MNLVCGVDPGGRTTGYVFIRGDEVIAHGLVVRPSKDSPITDYIADVLNALASYLPLTPDVFAIEGLVKLTPQMRDRPINPFPIVETGIIFGAAWVWARRAVGAANVYEVAPGGHGSLPLHAYPSDLIGPREGKAGTGKLRHARSAYDVARMGHKMSRGIVA